APCRVGDGAPVLETLLGQLHAVLGLRKLQPQLAQRPLSRYAAVLGRLSGLAAGTELLLRHAGLLAGLDEAPLQRLGLRGRPAVGVTRFAPLLPHDAAAQHLEAGGRLAV